MHTTLVNNHSGNVITAGDEQLRILTAKLKVHSNEGMIASGPHLDTIEREGRLLTDYITPLGNLAEGRELTPKIVFKANGVVQANIQQTTWEKFSIHPHALYQFGEKLGVPPSYLRELGTTPWGRKLASEILNNHSSHSSRQRVLIRAVGHDIRGVLSDQYRRLSSPALSKAFITAVINNGASITGAYVDDTRMWIDATLMRVVPIPTEKNGVLHIAYGARWSTSDFGDGAHDLRTSWMHVWCLNTAVSETMIHQVHLGARIPDNFQASERTYALDTKTQSSLVNDIVTKVFSRGNIENHARVIQQAANKEVDMDVELKKMRKGNTMLQGEIDEVRKVLVNNRQEDGVQGGSTLWKLAQGVSAIARTAEERRKRELEEIAGKLMLRVVE